MFFYIPKEFRFREKIETIEIHESEKISYSQKNHLFKFEVQLNDDDQEKTIIFDVNSNAFEKYYILLMEPEKNQEKRYEYQDNIYFLINKPGIYYVDFNVLSVNNKNCKGTFSYYLVQNLEKINLDKKIYWKAYDFQTELNMASDIFKISNLAQDTYVYFYYKELLDYYQKFENPFEICNDNNDTCIKDITFYKFLKDYNYTIKVNSIKYSTDSYYYYSFGIFPIFEDTVEHNQQGYYLFTDPKIFFIDLRDITELTAILKNGESIYSATSNYEITLDNINNFKFKHSYGGDKEKEFLNNQDGMSNYGVIILIPSFFNDNPSKVIITDKIILIDKEEDYNLDLGKNLVLEFKDNIRDKSNPLIEYNNIITIGSPIKNLKLILDFEEKELTDYIIQNYIIYPIYMERYTNNINITIKNIEPRYSFFEVIDSNFFTTYILKYLKYKRLDIDKTKSIILRRFSEDYSINEFLNYYIYNSNEKINFYIKTYYGPTDVYEFNLNDYNINLLNERYLPIITKPLKNYEKINSISNKIHSLENNTIISFNLDRDSLFDIYLEIDDNREINLLEEGDYILDNNGAKYLKKDIEYTFNFQIEHLFKLEPGFDAKVKIYDGMRTVQLSKLNPTGEFTSQNVKIKSNNNAMVYFYGKPLSFIQTKIDPKEKGKNVEIKFNSEVTYMIDFGFENYKPFRINHRYINKGGSFYIENFYDKLKTELARNEYLYVYSTIIQVLYILKIFIIKIMNIILMLYQKIQKKNH